MATRMSDHISLVAAVKPNQTRAIYERRRATLLACIDLLQKREAMHHVESTHDQAYNEKDPKWSAAANIGAAILAVGNALLALGLTPAEVDAVLAEQLKRELKRD